MRDSKPYIDYIRQLFAPELPLQSKTSESLRGKFPQLHGIQIGGEEGKLLQLLIRLSGAKTIVEVGSLAGYSALWMAEALPDGGVVHAINNDPEHFAMLCETAELWNTSTPHPNPLPQGDRESAEQVGKGKAKIIPHFGDGREVLEKLKTDAPYDMIFIDADKPGYPAYLDWAEQHIRPGGLIIGDNTLLFGTVWQEQLPAGSRVSKAAWHAMRDFNQRLADPSKYHSILVPTQEGMTVAIKRF